MKYLGKLALKLMVITTKRQFLLDIYSLFSCYGKIRTKRCGSFGNRNTLLAWLNNYSNQGVPVQNGTMAKHFA